MYSIENFKNSSEKTFENLFHGLLKSKYGSVYNEISNYGVIGDRKIDGILEPETAFAVYAPETYTDAKTISKIKKDFEGFFKHKNNGYWGNINKYIFVIKRERAGITPDVYETINAFKPYFDVSIWTLEEIAFMINGHQIFSEDGKKLNEFKNDVSDKLRYIIDTDFSCSPFSCNLTDEIEFICKKWSDPSVRFDDTSLNNLIFQISNNLSELLSYLYSPHYQFNNNARQMVYYLCHEDNGESRNYLKNTIEPNIFKIRKNIYSLYNELYSIQ